MSRWQPIDPELNDLAKRWKGRYRTLPDDFEHLENTFKDMTTKDWKHIRKFDSGVYGVYLVRRALGCNPKKLWLAYTESGQTAARLADCLTRYFWWARRQNGGPEPAPGDYNFNAEQEAEDASNTDVCDWLEACEQALAERGYFPDRYDNAVDHKTYAKPIKPKFTYTVELKEMVASTASVVRDIKLAVDKALTDQKLEFKALLDEFHKMKVLYCDLHVFCHKTEKLLNARLDNPAPAAEDTSEETMNTKMPIVAGQSPGDYALNWLNGHFYLRHRLKPNCNALCAIFVMALAKHAEETTLSAAAVTELRAILDHYKQNQRPIWRETYQRAHDESTAFLDALEILLSQDPVKPWEALPGVRYSTFGPLRGTCGHIYNARQDAETGLAAFTLRAGDGRELGSAPSDRAIVFVNEAGELFHDEAFSQPVVRADGSQIQLDTDAV